MHLHRANLCCQRRADPDERDMSAPESNRKVVGGGMHTEAFEELGVMSNLG